MAVRNTVVQEPKSNAERCTSLAAYLIRFGHRPDDYTLSCEEHLQEMAKVEPLGGATVRVEAFDAKQFLPIRLTCHRVSLLV